MNNLRKDIDNGNYIDKERRNEAYFLNSINYSLNRSFINKKNKYNGAVNNSECFNEGVTKN